MKGWLLFIAGLLCAAAVLVYFHKVPADFLGSLVPSGPQPGASSGDLPAADVLTPGEEPRAGDGLTSPPASGDCYLNVSVRVPNPWGFVTYQRGTELHYLEPYGDRWAVQKGIDQFTVTPRMVTDSLASALTPRGPASNPAARTATNAAPAE